MEPQARGVVVTGVSEWRDGQVRTSLDYLAAEEPLEIRVNKRPLTVTMRTPGHDLELAAGFLFTEGLIQDRKQIAALRQAGRVYCQGIHDPKCGGTCKSMDREIPCKAGAYRIGKSKFTNKRIPEVRNCRGEGWESHLTGDVACGCACGGVF